MRLSTCLLAFLLLVCYLNVSAQDEGAITKKNVVTGKSLYFSGGPTFQFGKNKGDYSGGLNLEVGYLVRLNRILSIGPSLSFTKFDYDESISDSYDDPNADGNNIFYEDGGYEIRIMYLEGGDLKLFSLGFNVKANFSIAKNLSVYGIGKPFVLLSSRSEITSSSENYWLADPEIPKEDQDNWDYGGPLQDLGPEERPKWAADTEFSGGLNLGVGAEFVLPSGITFLLQGVIGLTAPITQINTDEFPNTIQEGYDNPDFPLVKSGFTSFNISAGVAYRF